VGYLCYLAIFYSGRYYATAQRIRESCQRLNVNGRCISGLARRDISKASIALTLLVDMFSMVVKPFSDGL